MSSAIENVIKILGGANRVKIMTGATLVTGKNKLFIQGLKGAKLSNSIVIKYNEGSDSFDIEFAKQRGLDFKVVKTVNDVYLDRIINTLETNTGLVFKL